MRTADIPACVTLGIERVLPSTLSKSAPPCAKDHDSSHTVGWVLVEVRWLGGRERPLLGPVTRVDQSFHVTWESASAALEASRANRRHAQRMCVLVAVFRCGCRA